MSSHARCTAGAPRTPHNLGSHQGPFHSAPPPDDPQPAFSALSRRAWQTDREGQVRQRESSPLSPAARWTHGCPSPSSDPAPKVWPAHAGERQGRTTQGDSRGTASPGRVGPLPLLVVTASPACSHACNEAAAVPDGSGGGSQGRRNGCWGIGAGPTSPLRFPPQQRHSPEGATAGAS